MARSEEENAACKGDKKIPLIVVLAVIVLITPFLAKLIADKYAVSKIDTILEAAKDECYGIYDSAGYDLWTKSLKVKNFSLICADEEAARFDLISFSDIKTLSAYDIPSRMLIRFDNAVVNADAKIFGRFGEIASKIGMTAVHYRGIVSYSLADGKNTISFTLNADNIGTAIGEISIGDPRKETPAGKSLAEIFEQLFYSSNISLITTFKDTGFTNMAIERYAQTIGEENSAKALGRALQGIENRIRNQKNNKPETAYKLEEIYKFIQNPGELSITVKSEDNMSLNEIVKSLNYSDWKGFANSVENFKPTITSK